MGRPFVENPKIDDMIRRIPVLLSPTELQGKILCHICTMKNASYDTLIRATGKDRITILQSIESLIKYHYIEKEKVHPEHEKSKLIFIPTLRGKASAWSYFGLDIKDTIETKQVDEITDYIGFIKDVFRDRQQKPMLNRLFNTIEREYLDIEQEGPDTKRKLIKECFTEGILELVQQEDYNATELFNNKGIQWLNKLYSHRELKEVKELLVRTNKNLTSTIERFRV
jgi:hypothetical protein